MDSENDIISISCQEDLIEAFESMPQLRLLVEENIEAVRLNQDPDYSMRSSSLNLAGVSPHILNNQNNFLYSDKRLSSEFEDVFYEEGKSQQSLHT